MGGTARTKVLFLCTGNSCRSQMAEGWARHLRPDALEAWSAGVSPAPVDPRAVKAMAEAGVDISAQRSKPIDDVDGIPFDYVITLCDNAHTSCPVFPARTLLAHMPFDDPPRLAAGASSEEEAMAHYQRVRDEIREMIVNFPGSVENS